MAPVPVLSADSPYKVSPVSVTVAKNAVRIIFDIAKYHRCFQHIRLVEIPRYRVYNGIDSNEDLGVKYILGEIDESNW